MKHFLTIVLLFVAASAFGQSGTVPLKELRDMYSQFDRLPVTTADVKFDHNRGSVLLADGVISTPTPVNNWDNWESHQKCDSVYSTYDTTVLNAGKVKCDHSWVDKRNNVRISTCLVYHGQTGCPDTWLDKERICSLCLRYEHIREGRGVIRLLPEVTFEELKARIK